MAEQTQTHAQANTPNNYKLDDPPGPPPLLATAATRAAASVADGPSTVGM